MLTQIRPTGLREQVVRQIRAAIIEGRLKPNDHIVEANLTEQLGVSRTPVREALIILETEGLIVAPPNRGCFVRAFTEGDINEIFSMRTTLENFAGSLIIDKLGDADFHHLYRSVENQRAAIEEANFKNVRTIDMAFHEYLVLQSNHELLVRNWTAIVAQIAAVLYLRASAIPNYDELQSIQDHLAIIEAYREHNLEKLFTLNEKINQRVAAECRLAVQQG